MGKKDKRKKGRSEEIYHGDSDNWEFVPWKKMETKAGKVA